MTFNSGQIKTSKYHDALSLFWGDLYGEGGVTLYSQQRFGRIKPEWINAEHVFPMAWVVKSLNCLDRQCCREKSKRFRLMESDLHNIYPARKDLNAARGSYSFGEVEGEERNWLSFDFEIDYQRNLVEPPHVHRGEIARSIFYMVDAYGLKLFRKQMLLLRNWNELDPPSEEEQRRNHRIEQLQGGRNYFIDHPSAIDTLKVRLIHGKGTG
ncbi:MAG: endonuclease [Cocleimonas sp.]|nr:endonuclease [Cocleimonas sp.]